MYDFELDSFEDIATTADGFTSLGRSPAVSDLCDVVTFYGELSAAGAEALGTNPGPGIFASIEIDHETGARRIVRLAGRLIENNAAEGGNDDGYCDPDETCMQGELGFRQDGTPIFFSAFDTLNRVAVIHHPAGVSGIEDDVFVTSFQGVPNVASDKPGRPFSNQSGLWTVTTQVRRVDETLRERPRAPVPAVQVGDVVDGRTVNAVNVYDQLASVRSSASSAETPGSHRLTFHLATNNGNLIIRAKRQAEVPVIFIPGVGGSILAEKVGTTYVERWPGGLNSSNYPSLSLAPGEEKEIEAIGAVKSVLTKNVYEELLSAMTAVGDGGLTEYQVGGDPTKQTFDGCDLTQAPAQPNLFVFAYDWRKSNSENAVKLRGYIGCVQRFYPETKVDIIAHSMGGLLARSYILNFQGIHDVRRMVTIASPFLGAPRSLKVLEDGGFFEPSVNAISAAITAIKARQIASANRIFKRMLPHFRGAHELLPSEAYFQLGGVPFIERFDFNGDGVVSAEGYNYSIARNTFNSRFTTMPYEANRLFHTLPQDDWRNDTSGVEYYQLFGEQDRDKTPKQIVAKRRIFPSRQAGRIEARFDVITGPGDKTVPVLSAQRIGNEDLNAGIPPEPFKPRSDLEETDADVEHNGLTANTRVQKRIFEILGITAQSAVGSASHQGMEQNMSENGEENMKREANYLIIENVETLQITDELGRTNTRINDDFEFAIPEVSYSPEFLGEPDTGWYLHDLTLPDDHQYTIKFRTGIDPVNAVNIDLVRGIGNAVPSYAVRYLDQELPANVECLLTVTGQGMEDLRYDSNGDGTYDVVVPAHVRVSGAAAQDVTAPEVTFAKDMATGLISVNAADSESGVGTIYYRYAGENNFRIYTAPFLPESNSLEAFADDNVGNRSSPVTASLVSISGRVKDAYGRPISMAIVTLTDSQGISRSLSTGTFGYYIFNDVLTGHSYVLAVSSRRYSFEPRTVNLTEELTGFDFIANP